MALGSCGGIGDHSDDDNDKAFAVIQHLQLLSPVLPPQAVTLARIFGVSLLNHAAEFSATASCARLCHRHHWHY